MLQRLITVSILACLIVFTFWLFYFEKNNVAADFEAEYIVVKDGCAPGQDVRVPKRPQRVVCLTASSLEIWLKVGGAEQLIAAPRFKYAPDWVYEKMPSQVIDLGPSNTISLEKLMLHKPDLVIASGMSASQHLAGDFFAKQNIPLLTLPTQSLENTFAEIQLLGTLTGKEDLAQKEISRLKNNIAAESKRNQDKPRKKVLMIFGTSTSFSMITPSSRQGDMLRLAGADNIISDTVTESKYIPFSLEFAAQQDPDYVLFVNHGEREKMQIQMEKALSANSAWNVIRAVREGKVHVLPPELFAISPGLRSDEAVVYLGRLLYPD